jgi:two-component system, chemotaxis family, chemotaxis protein CheY
MLHCVTADMFSKVPCSRDEGARPRPLQKERCMDPVQYVLIIDDNAVNRRMAQVVFQKLGWEVATVDSGEQALLHLAAHRPDLVLLDISMPGMNGLDVCQRIRADHTLAGLRVIAYTAHAFLEQQRRFLAGGFDDVLVKPISFRAVQEMLMAQTPCP